MPLSDRRLASATDDVSADRKRRDARGSAAAQPKRARGATANGAARKRKAGRDPAKAATRASPPASRRQSRREARRKPAAKPPTSSPSSASNRDIDLVLHLPMRYEDETSLTPIGELMPGDIAQTEGVVFDNEIAYRPRRQLLVKMHDDAGDELTLRFLNFYGSQVKQMAIGVRLRVRGDVRGGFFGMEMVHPAVRAVDEDTPLPQALTPVYPSTAGVIAGVFAQGDRQRAVARVAAGTAARADRARVSCSR